MTISSAITNAITAYETVVDDIMSGLGVNCELVYVPIRQSCANCIFDTLGQKSSNIYNGTGPEPFTDGLCPYCNGLGFKLQQVTETIKLRINWSPKPGQNGVPVIIPEGSIQIIGFLSDLPKVMRTASIKINSSQSDNHCWTYTVKSEPVTHGMGHKKQFSLLLERGIDDL